MCIYNLLYKSLLSSCCWYRNTVHCMVISCSTIALHAASSLFAMEVCSNPVSSVTKLQQGTGRTPRKSDNPQHTPSRAEQDDSVLLTFKLIPSELTPELDITATTPVTKKNKAKRRLWAGDSEPLVYIDLNIKNQSTRVETGSVDENDSDSRASSSHTTPELELEAVNKCYSLKCSKNSSKTKTCASCGTKKTPLWRDADDGTPYCNACGIRFKKYRVRCPACLYIPRKEEKTNNCCFLCGTKLVRCRFRGQHF